MPILRVAASSILLKSGCPECGHDMSKHMTVIGGGHACMQGDCGRRFDAGFMQRPGDPPRVMSDIDCYPCSLRNRVHTERCGTCSHVKEHHFPSKAREGTVCADCGADNVRNKAPSIYGGIAVHDFKPQDHLPPDIRDMEKARPANERSHKTATSTFAHTQAFGDTYGHSWEDAKALRRHLIQRHSYRPEDFGKPFGQFKISQPASYKDYMRHASVHNEFYPMGEDKRIKKGRSSGEMVQCSTCKLVRPDRDWYPSCPRCGDRRIEAAKHHQVWHSPTSAQEWADSQRVNDDDWTKFKERGMKSLFVLEDPIDDVTARSLFELVVDEPRMMKDFEKARTTLDEKLGGVMQRSTPKDFAIGGHQSAWMPRSGTVYTGDSMGHHAEHLVSAGIIKHTDAFTDSGEWRHEPGDLNSHAVRRHGLVRMTSQPPSGPGWGEARGGGVYVHFPHVVSKEQRATLRSLAGHAERDGREFGWECEHHQGSWGRGAREMEEHLSKVDPSLKKAQPGMMKLRPGEKGWMTIRGEGPMSGRPIRAEMGRGMKLRPPTERHKANLGPDIGMREYTPQESKSIRALPHEKAHADDLLKQYRESSPDQRKRGHNWYPRASQIVDRYAGQHEMPTGKKVGYSRSQISGALAALSPRQNWGENVFMLDRVVRAHQHGTEFKRVRGLGFRGNGQKAWRILGGADPAEVLGEKKRTGQKVRAFHHALENFDGKEHEDHSKCDQPTVVDQLMDRAMHGSQKPNHRPTSIDGRVYREHSNAVRVAAMRAGVEPWALQATVWAKMNDEGGKTPRVHVGAEGQPHMLKLAGVWPGSTKRRKLVLKSHSVWRMTSS